MTLIRGIFAVVVQLGCTPFLIGIHEIILYKVSLLKFSPKLKSWLKLISIIMLLGLIALTFIGWIKLSEWLQSMKMGDYISVLIYTLLLALISSNILYQSPEIVVNSTAKAFKKGFTESSVNNILAQLPLKVIINLLYLVVLIIAQIEDLGYIHFSDGVSYFCTLNKYGIVIILTVEKIIKSFKPEKERAKVITETFVKKEKEEEKQREAVKNKFKEFKQILKERKQQKKLQLEENNKEEIDKTDEI